MKLWWILLLVCVAMPMLIGAATSDAEVDLWEDDDDDKDTIVRTVRGTKERGNNGNGNSQACRYNKGQWSECDPKTNMRTRVLTLKKGDKTCEQTKSITKKCKKACRYEKGQWSPCVNQSITRVDNLKATSDPTCDKTRRVTKRCKTENGGKKNNKDRSGKKANKQQQ